jgi:hypothetical protein
VESGCWTLLLQPPSWPGLGTHVSCCKRGCRGAGCANAPRLVCSGCKAANRGCLSNWGGSAGQAATRRDPAARRCLGRRQRLAGPGLQRALQQPVKALHAGAAGLGGLLRLCGMCLDRTLGLASKAPSHVVRTLSG